MTGGDDNKQNPVPHQQSRELIDWVASRVRDFVAERLEPLFATAIEKFLDTAGAASSQGEQSLFFDAYKHLRVERQALGNVLLMTVDYHFRELGRPPSPGDDGVDLSLQLVANDILEEMIILDNMVSKAVSSCGVPLELLTTRLGAVVGRTLSEQDNPLMPEWLCEAFSRQVATLKLDLAPKFALYRIFEAVMLAGWPALVQECNEYLRQAGVLPDLEKRRPAIRKRTSADSLSKTDGLSKADAPPKADALSKTATAQALRAGDEGGPAAPKGTQDTDRHAFGERTSFAGDGAGEPGALSGGEGHQGVMRGTVGSAFARRGADADTRSGDVLSDLQRHLRERGAGRSGGSGGAQVGDGTPRAPALGADQLAAMFSAWRESRDREQLLSELASRGLEGALESILATHNHGPDSLRTVDRGLLRVIDRTFSRLADRLRQQHETNLLLSLELPAAWLTLKDPLFLERQSHPGRRLINELCRVASILGAEESRNDPLRGKVDEIVERLNGFDVTLRQLSELLTDLIDVIERDRRTTGLREERVLQEADSQARLAQAHGHVVGILTDRLVGRRWPGFLVPFCEKAWSRVMFLTLLRQGTPSGQAALSGEWRKIQGLLDRLLVLASARRPVAEAERVELVETVAAELEHIGYDPGESRRHLDSLERFLADLAGAGRDDDVFVDAIALDLPGQPPPREDVPRELDSETLAFVDALRRGAWVEFRDGDKPVRCKLAGTIGASSRLIFTNRRGVKVAEEHRHRMAVKMQEGKVIVLDNSHLFDQAYNEVINEVHNELSGQTSRVG